MHASPKQQIASEGDLEVVPVFIVLRRRVRELSDPLEPKLDREYVLGHLTDLTENQVLTIAEQVSQLAFRQAGFNDVIALADSFDATKGSRINKLPFSAGGRIDFVVPFTME